MRSETAGSGWAGNSSILKSTDQGNTWTTTRLGIVMDGNAGADETALDALSKIRSPRLARSA